jgi:FAD/FMN-containing dehydrogenase
VNAELVAELIDVVGESHVLVDADVRTGFEVDWTRRFGGPSAAIVRPGTVDEVRRVVSVCASRGVPIVPQGGNTGLVGGGVPGSIPSTGAATLPVILSTARLDRVRDIDTLAGQVTVEAGVTLSLLEQHLQGTGWEFGVDLGARQTATLGGMVATNAGGTRVLRYGSMRANLLGVEAVLGTGAAVSHLSGLVKDNTGYDIAGLLCGSEGTLGIVTAARLRLVPSWPDRLAVAVFCTSWADAAGLATRVRREVDGLDGLEAIDSAGAAVAAGLGVRNPIGDAPVTLFIVWAGRGEPPQALIDLVADRQHVVGEPRALLEPRDRQSEAIARTGIPHKFDVTLPLRRLAAFTDAVTEALRDLGSLYLFGHPGDGNLHVNVVGPEPGDQRVDDVVLGLVARFGGSVSAEHGIGRAKSAYLHLSRGAEEIDMMRAVKRALDPRGIMNPGVIFPEGRA